LIDVDGGVLVKRGTTELLVSGAGSRELLVSILVAAGRSGGVSLAELRDRFASSDPGGSAGALLDELRVRRILVDAGAVPEAPAPETALDVLAWDAGTSVTAYRAAVAETCVDVVGVNMVSRRLVPALESDGFTVRCFDDPGFRNVRLFGGGDTPLPRAWTANDPEPYETWFAASAARSVDCLVVCSDFGGFRLLSDWHAVAFENGWKFLPVVLQDLVGFAGPLVIPHESACFECFLTRREASAAPSPYAREAERHAFEGQSIAASHPAMASVLGDVAALELTKFFGSLWRSELVNRTIEINLMAGRMQTHRVLKLPRCRVCSPLNERDPVALLRDEFLAGFSAGE